jgi:hypothetical protein
MAVICMTKAGRPMRDVSKMKFICSSFCRQYESDAKFYIDEAHSSGVRQLVVVYDKGKEFAAGIPRGWTDRDVENLILWPMKDPAAPYPAWEVPARSYASPMLFAWWQREIP